MCLITPAKIIEIRNNTIRVKIDKREQNVKSAVPNLRPNDWVLVNADLAVEKISEKEAKEVLELLRNLLGCNGLYRQVSFIHNPAAERRGQMLINN